MRVDAARAIATREQLLEENITPAMAQVIKSEITGGILAACKNQDMVAGLTFVLHSLAGWRQEQAAIRSIPSIGFAVAGSLITAHVLGSIDMLAAPRGGHGWLPDQFLVLETD